MQKAFSNLTILVSTIISFNDANALRYSSSNDSSSDSSSTIRT